jgi:CubicO group peptidase (beta-lactamase class C family)
MTARAYSRKDITLGNWRQHPFSEWSFQNVSELVPTAEITPPRAGEDLVAEPGLIASLSIRDSQGDSMTALEYLRQSHTDRFVMMRDGVVLDEWLAPHADGDRPHVIFSISKSITGMLAGIAAGDG